MKKKLNLLVLSLLSAPIFAQFSWNSITQETDNFKSTAIVAGKAIAVGVLALSAGFLIYKLVTKNPDKTNAIIYFIVALLFNTFVWIWLGV